MPSAASDLFSADDVADRDLHMSLELLRGTEYDQGDGLANAFKLVQSGAVTLAGEGLYHVKGRTRTYDVGATCQCEDATKRKNTHCYHKAAVQLYKNWQLHLGKNAMPEPSLPLGPSTTDERLAQQPSQTPQVVSETLQVSEVMPASEVTPQPVVEAPVDAIRLPLPLGRMLRPLHAILADLRRPLPDNCIPSYKGPGNTEIDFLSWHQVTHLLHTYAPGWYPEVGQVFDLDTFTLTVKIVILSAEGRTSYEGVGRDKGDEFTGKAFGDRSRRAYANAIKHAAQLLGMDWLQEANERNQSLAALDAHLLKEQTERLQLLAATCEKAGLDKAAYIGALQRQAGVQKRKDIPVAMLEEAVSCVESYATAQKE